MNIFCMDTSGPAASVALWQNGVLTHEIGASHGLTHSQTIMVMADQLFEGANIAPKDIDLFAVVAGPGSFTGVRIGVASIKGLAQATDKPCVALNALETLAMGVQGFGGVVCPILDARRGQVYAAAFDTANIGSRPVRLLKDAALPLEEYLAAFPKDRPLLFVGDALALHKDAIAEGLVERALFAPAHLSCLRSGAGCSLAALCPEEYTDYLQLKPIYLRAPQAERERLKKQQAVDNG